MSAFTEKVTHGDTRSHFARLPFVLLLTLGLLLSLLHCAVCELPFVKTDLAAVTMNVDPSSVPDTPEQQLPCSHCLSHVTIQHLMAVVTPADLIHRTLAVGREQSPAALAGLPLFKPPRA
jgi:hypothetical protein